MSEIEIEFSTYFFKNKRSNLPEIPYGDGLSLKALVVDSVVYRTLLFSEAIFLNLNSMNGLQRVFEYPVSVWKSLCFYTLY